MSALRKALGDTQREPQFIANVPGRGYSFIAPITRNAPAGESPVIRPQQAMPLSSAARVFGRETAIATITSQLTRSRLLTIVGPGGIGKSVVARAVAAAHGDETVWIDLCEVASGTLVPTVVASVLGIPSRSEDLVGDIAVHMRDRDSVMVLDSCEHVVSDAATFAEAVLPRASRLRILATSREPLRADGERVHRIPPLEMPASWGTAQAALTSPAVQLFVDRADACLGNYELTDDDAPHVAEICSRLDGIALAIELAAGRLETIGVQALARSLNDCFRVLTRGRRTALPRHQTLRATLDWSYMILPPSEQVALRTLSVLRGWFSSKEATALRAGCDIDDLLAALVAKSLIVADAASGETLYRLLDTTRLYAAEKLAEAEEVSVTIARLSDHVSDELEAAGPQLYSTPSSSWSQDFARQVANLRIALDWAFGDGGDPQAGVRLTVAALPLFFRMSLLDECLAFVTLAISHLETRSGLDEPSRMKLYAALGWPQMRSTDAPEHGIAAWTKALEIAQTIGDIDHQLRAIWALWVDAINRAEPRLGLQYTERFRSLAVSSGDPADTTVGKRLHGATLHWLGRHAEARDQLREMLEEYASLPEGRQSVRFQFDQSVTARVILARTLWLLGDTEGALTEVEQTISYATKVGHHLSLCNVLAEAACPIALLCGNVELASDYIGLLREHTKALSLDVWHSYADCFDAELQLRAGRPEDCLRLLRGSMSVQRDAGFTLFHTSFHCVAAQAHFLLGDAAEALKTLDLAIAHCHASGERWCLAELFRVKARVLSGDGSSDGARAARDELRSALEAATQDGALAWELRVTRDISDLGTPIEAFEVGHSSQAAS